MLTIFGPHLDHLFHGVYMSAKHMSPTLTSFSRSIYVRFWLLGQFLTSRFTIFFLHFDGGVGTVSWYIDLIYFLDNYFTQFTIIRRDIDLSTFVLETI